MIIYKIKSLTTGRFSTGGDCPNYTKKGKTWAEKGHVSSHLSSQSRYGQQSYRVNQCVIVCYDFEAGTETEFDIDQWRTEVAERRAVREASKEKRQAEDKLKYAQDAVAQAKRNLERLQQEAARLAK